MTKKTLYIVISDSGDGSNGLGYTFDGQLIELMDQNQDSLDDSYQSGDGLQVHELTVPLECTYESLGISQWSVIQREDFEYLDEMGGEDE